jgi:hypothetical protein
MADDSGGETGAEAAIRTFVITMGAAVLFCASMFTIMLQA